MCFLFQGKLAFIFIHFLTHAPTIFSFGVWWQTKLRHLNKFVTIRQCTSWGYPGCCHVYCAKGPSFNDPFHLSIFFIRYLCIFWGISTNKMETHLTTKKIRARFNQNFYVLWTHKKSIILEISENRLEKSVLIQQNYLTWLWSTFHEVFGPVSLEIKHKFKEPLNKK